LGGKLVK